MIALLLAACGPGATATPAGPPMYATGVVIAVDGTDAAHVSSFTLRQADGTILELTVGTLSLEGGGLPAPHLREHLVSGEPIDVIYVSGGAADGVLQAYTDAAE